jgi:5-methylcytosine-specific restriction endonuclease McrA
MTKARSVPRAQHAEVYGHEFRASERWPNRCIPCGEASNKRRARRLGVKPAHRREAHAARFGHDFVARANASTCLICHREDQRRTWRLDHGLDPSVPRKDWRLEHEAKHGHRPKAFESGKRGCAECARIYTIKRSREQAEHLRSKRLAKYWSDPARARKKSQEWRRAHPEAKQRIQRRMSIARRLNGDRAGVEYALFIANDPCTYCGRVASTVDHIVPVNGGGSHGPENLTAACASCNSRKRDRSMLAFLVYLATLSRRPAERPAR